MAVDYLSALNVGSGLNVTQIVDALVDAEKVPQESRIQKQLDERNISISSLGDVKSDLGIFKSNLDVYKNETGLVTESTNNSAVGVTNNGKIARTALYSLYKRKSARCQPYTRLFRIYI